MSISIKVKIVEKSRFQSELSKNLNFKISKNLDFNKKFLQTFLQNIVYTQNRWKFPSQSNFWKNLVLKKNEVSILVKIFEKSHLSTKYLKNLNSIQTLRKISI